MNFCHPIAKSNYFQKLGESTLVFMSHSTKVPFTNHIFTRKTTTLKLPRLTAKSETTSLALDLNLVLRSSLNLEDPLGHLCSKRSNSLPFFSLSLRRLCFPMLRLLLRHSFLKEWHPHHHRRCVYYFLRLKQQ